MSIEQEILRLKNKKNLDFRERLYQFNEDLRRQNNGDIPKSKKSEGWKYPKIKDIRYTSSIVRKAFF